ncbi:MAG TPA: VOC family protein [Candidatus Paceibacterota bacterium]|nr:VOC family protein [Candidatus Paceibacterota bacterium]
MQKITPFLWFDSRAEEAAHFYVSIFKDSRILDVARYPENSPGKAGSVMLVSFELFGQKFSALNGGPVFTFTEAVSFMVECEDQAEIDHYWNSLTADGGKEVECGWLKDKYGLSWQIVPKMFSELMARGDKEKNDRMLKALWTMKKLDIAELQKAYDGTQ